MPRFELRLLGSATRLTAGGRPVGGGATHRWRLAPLTRLAAAHPGGLSRTTLVGLLWPERDEPAARQPSSAARRPT